ncbi:hypothetical protein K438DRAFT_1776391 [Mycena galopus ATCC 62051]|nr:hypothetical protein K438DRAFT_1776391 [Mycena galopus ATCC 62051]
MTKVRASRRKSTIVDFVFDAAATPTAPELGAVMKSYPFSRKLERRKNSVASNARRFVCKSFAKILSHRADEQAAMRLLGNTQIGITYTDVRQQDAKLPVRTTLNLLRKAPTQVKGSVDLSLQDDGECRATTASEPESGYGRVAHIEKALAHDTGI